MSAEQVRKYESAASEFGGKINKKAQESTDRDFVEVMQEKRKKEKNSSHRKEETWFDKRQKRIRLRLRYQAIEAAERRGEMSRVEQLNQAKSQAASFNRLHNFLIQDTEKEKRMPETVTDKERPRTANTYDMLRRAYLLSGQRKKAGNSVRRPPDKNES